MLQLMSLYLVFQIGITLFLTTFQINDLKHKILNFHRRQINRLFQDKNYHFVFQYSQNFQIKDFAPEKKIKKKKTKLFKIISTLNGL